MSPSLLTFLPASNCPGLSECNSHKHGTNMFPTKDMPLEQSKWDNSMPLRGSAKTPCPTSPEAADLREYQHGLLSPQLWHQLRNDNLVKLRCCHRVAVDALSQQPMLALFLSCLKMLVQRAREGGKAGTSHVFICHAPTDLSVPVPTALGFTFFSGRRSPGEMLLGENAAMVQWCELETAAPPQLQVTMHGGPDKHPLAVWEV